MAGVLVEEKEEEKLRKIRVRDSKLLTKKQREFLYKEIIKIATDYKLIIVQPEEIDRAVHGHDGLNLNRLEARKSAEIINYLKPDKSIIDAPSNNISVYKEYLSVFVNNKQITLILEHKADVNYPVVSAASIIAKVTRDKEIEKIKEDINYDFGSGYMSDPKTIDFLEKNYQNHKELFRKSWLPYKNILNKQNQKKLEDFSDFIESVENKNESIIDQLSRLEDFGYKFIPVKTSYESVRMKGPCTITLYKTGKLLIQGKPNNKEILKRFLQSTGVKG